MDFANGGPFKGAELSHVVLASLDAIPSGVKARRIDLPNDVAADCYNHAYAAALDVLQDPLWRYRRRR